MNLENFFSPQSVAVVGASRDSKKIGHGILKNIIDSGYKGKIYPVNPNTNEILTLNCYPSVSEIKPIPDLVVVSVPVPLVLGIVRDAALNGVRNFVIITAGFNEIGPEGREREEELKELKKEYNLKILGPNCLGFINTTANLNVSFANTPPRKGKIAFASQSGALCTAVLDWANESRVGFSHFVSLGNEAGITEINLLNLWEEDPGVSCIALYLEGIQDGRQFYHVAQRISLKKPIIIISPGQSNEAKKAISSHTGSIAGEAQATATAFKQAGLIHARNLEDLFDFMSVFAATKMPQGRNVAIVSNAGGPSILTTDEIVNQNLQLAPLGTVTIEKLKDKLPRIINLRDPLDLIGDALSERYEEGLKEILAEDSVHAVIVLLSPQIMTEIEATASVIVKLSKKFNKPILAAFMGGTSVNKGVRILNDQNIANFSYPERAVVALSKMIEYREWKENNSGRTFFIKQEKPLIQLKNLQKLHQHIEKAGTRETKFLTDQENFEILKSFGIPIPSHGFANNIAGVMTMARFIGLPIVMKISSPDYPHKSDLGGVKVGLDNFEKVGKAAKELELIMQEKATESASWSFLLQHMVNADYEIIIGAKKDPNFGHIIMFGAGGIYTEVYKDVSFRLSPLDKNEVEGMIDETKVSQILSGLRGKPAVNKVQIIDILLKVSDMVSQIPDIQELDLNPVMATQDDAWVVDAKIRV